MKHDIKLDGFGTISMSDGMPSDFSDYAIPQALAYHANGPWGMICFQEIETAKVFLRHFLFFLNGTITFNLKNSGNRLQSLLSIRGRFDHNIRNHKAVTIEEREFLLFTAFEDESTTTVYGGKVSSLLSTHYSKEIYADLLNLFPALGKDLKKSTAKAHYFNYPARVARHTVHDAINAIWYDHYIPKLVAKHLEIRLQSSLFTLLAQTYSPVDREPISSLEYEKAVAARDIILKDIKVHLSAEEVATQIHCSAGWLKKAFSKVYGTGMFHFLRQTRMERARELFIKRESLKAVALEVGMKPRNFPKEFKAFFGYTVTAFKKGLNT
jgi:AraC-like DNA-binding protein